MAVVDHQNLEGDGGGDILYFGPPPPDGLALYCCEFVWMKTIKMVPPLCPIVLFRSIGTRYLFNLT